jgi:hypothetical protein
MPMCSRDTTTITMYELPYSLILEVQAPGSWNVSGMDLGGSVNYIVNFPAFLERQLSKLSCQEPYPT